MSKIMFGLLVAIGFSLLGVIGDAFIKLSGNGPKYMDVKWFVLGVIAYGLTAFGWFYAMKNVKFATLGTYYAVCTVLFVTFASVVFFKERLNVYEILGITGAIGSLVLLARFA